MADVEDLPRHVERHINIYGIKVIMLVHLLCSTMPYVYTCTFISYYIILYHLAFLFIFQLTSLQDIQPS